MKNTKLSNQEKQIIRSYLITFIQQFIKDFKLPKQNELIDCPICKEKASVNFFPLNANKMNCFNPDCGSHDIFDLVKYFKSSMKDLDEDSICDYLVSSLKIDLTNPLTTILDKYEKAGFALIPLYPNSKIPTKEAKGWQNSSHKNKEIWKDWIERQYNIGVNLGKVSNIIAVDIDSDETYEKVKHLLGNTLVQTTKRGRHFVYNYDPDFTKTLNKVLRDDGFEMELRTDGAYIVVAPSSVEGEVRMWNNEKITDMPKELKEFFLKYQTLNIQEQSVEEEIQEAINNEKIDVVDLSGKRNDTFIKLAGILRKKLNKEQVKYALDIVSNNLIDKPIPKKELYGILGQIEKYNYYDKEELSKTVLDRLDIIEEGSAFQIASSLKYEQKDVEDVLKYLQDENKIINVGKNRYKRLTEIEWDQDFTQMGVPIDFEVPYFHKYARFDQGNMIVIGGKTGQGKTHLSSNFIKHLVDQGIHPYLISTEAGSKIGKICTQMGLKIGDFSFKTVRCPTDIELKDNAVTIIDWLKPKGGDYAKTDHTFEQLNNQLEKHKGFLIVMVQIRRSGEFFAPDQIDFYSALTARYCYSPLEKDKEGRVVKWDNENTYFETTKIRDSRTGNQYITIPTKFNKEKKILESK